VRIEDNAAWSKIDRNLTPAEFILTTGEDSHARTIWGVYALTAEPGAAVFFRPILRQAKLG
jgi:hypothetical protein